MSSPGKSKPTMDKPNRRNFYRILHVQPDAPLEVIKASYRTLMQKLRCHPDLGGDQWNASIINEAYQVLSQTRLRRKYDEELRKSRKDVNPVTRRSNPHSTLKPSVRPAPMRRSSLKHCIFCGTANNIVSRSYSDQARCRSCRSPLAHPPSRKIRNSERRAVKRFILKDEIPFLTKWPQVNPHKGRVVDLSPMGMQFIAQHPLNTNQVIKLDGRGLSAVARVVRCSNNKTQPDTGYLIGVQFLTLSNKLRTTAS